MVKNYETENLIIYWKPDICQHSGKCVKGAPKVFDVGRKAGLIPETGTDNQIMNVIAQCPSGALSYKRK